MNRKSTRLLVCLFWPLLVSNLAAQPILIEDFEGDLSNWTVIEGQMEITDQQVLQGQGALWMHLPNDDWANHILEHNSFSENFGRYTYHFYTDGEASDADLYFQYIDDNHYYKVSCKPAGTDNPELILCKGTPNGEIVLEMLEPSFDQSRWFKVTVERWCDGHTHVYIDDEQVISIDDYDHFGKGTIRLRGWAENTYIDEVYFEPHQPELFIENMRICSGDSVWLGGVYRSAEGVYLDTISDENAPCTQVREVQLSIGTLDTLVQSHTLCPGDSLMIDDEWVSTAGEFFFESRQNGCPVMLDVSVAVRESSPSIDSTSFCPHLNALTYRSGTQSLVLPMGEEVDSVVITTPGIYELSLVDDDGCHQPLTLAVGDACATPIYIPNAFSPNEDQVNDRFTIAPIESSDVVHMTIFDRWGGVVFEANQASWDGRVNGQRVMNGVYLYRILHNGRPFTGTVTVLR